MHVNQSYIEYLQHKAVVARPIPAACLEFFLLDQALDRHSRREAEQLSQLATTFDWHLSRDYEKALRDGYTLVVANTARTIVWVSHRFFSMTGYHFREAVGQTPRFLQGPDTDPEHLRQLSDELADVRRLRRTRPIHQRLINYRKDGKPYLCTLEIDPIWTKQGDLTHFIALEKEV